MIRHPMVGMTKDQLGEMHKQWVEFSERRVTFGTLATLGPEIHSDNTYLLLKESFETGYALGLKTTTNRKEGDHR